MSELRIAFHAKSEDYFSACSLELDSSRSHISAHRVDLPSSRVSLISFFPPSGAFWGLQFYRQKAHGEWEDTLQSEPKFVRFATSGLKQCFGSVEQAYPGFLPFDVLGKGRNVRVGNRLDPNVVRFSRTRVQSVCIPLRDRAVEFVCGRFARYVRQLHGFSVIRQASGSASSEEWLSSIHPRLYALFKSDHLRGVFGPALVDPVADLEYVLANVSAEEAQGWLSPLVLAEEFVRFLYPIPTTLDAGTVQIGKLFGIGTDFPARKDLAALLRAKVIRKWGWPTWVNTLKAYSEPSLHRALLHGSRPWKELESEVQGILTGARERYPVLFEPEVQLDSL